ncbi:hypothetical protein GCM10017600_88010 [Streptosporangium carneum]|uniref:Uncharacterized protein n=1 Tax=Streptosporangium carneum TaxID=47481 RepID=A0A9W6MIV5_9ACTN|nr:hypothetical protein GCM10017600_88010 [Streptosporangium carneum]
MVATPSSCADYAAQSNRSIVSDLVRASCPESDNQIDRDAEESEISVRLVHEECSQYAFR